MNKLFLYACLCPALMTGCSAFTSHSAPLAAPFTDSTPIKADAQHCREPSGIVFSERRGTLFVVDDEGHICELHPDGTLIQAMRIGKADLEGITINPATGLLYAIKEGSATILELHPDSLDVLRRFPTASADGTPLPTGKDSNRGAEAITFVPDPTHPSGGTFFIAAPGFHTRHSRHPAAVYEVDAPLHHTASTGSSARITRHFEPGMGDLSGLHYDHGSRQLLLISDKHNALVLVTTSGAITARHTLPGEHQEGITLDADGYLYIAEDSGKVIKYTFDTTMIPSPEQTPCIPAGSR